MRELDIHKNFPVSDTKLTIGLRVGFISSHLTSDKLFPVNPRAITGPPKMSLLLEARSMPGLIMKPRFILVTHTDDLGLYITFNQQGKMFVQNLNRIVRKPNVTPRQFPYCTLPYGLDSYVTQLLVNLSTKPSVFYYLPIVSCNLVLMKLLLYSAHLFLTLPSFTISSLAFSPFLTGFTSLQNIFLLPSKSFPSRYHHRQPASLFATLTLCFTSLCAGICHM